MTFLQKIFHHMINYLIFNIIWREKKLKKVVKKSEKRIF